MCQDGPKKCHGNGMQWPSPSIDLGPQAFLPKSEALATSTSHGTPAARISTLRVLPVPVSPETSARRRGFTWFHTLNCKKYSIPVNSALCPNNPEHTLLARPTFMMRLVTLEQHGTRPRPRPRRWTPQWCGAMCQMRGKVVRNTPKRSSWTLSIGWKGWASTILSCCLVLVFFAFLIWSSLLNDASFNLYHFYPFLAPNHPPIPLETPRLLHPGSPPAVILDGTATEWNGFLQYSVAGTWRAEGPPYYHSWNSTNKYGT